MKMTATISVRGKNHEWAVDWHASQAQIDGMIEDGLDVGIIHNTIPAWVVDVGLTRPWCFVQDAFNFRNPFGK